ncbi:glycosyltransferase family 2 protein [Fusobacterium ulcerans]|uniref:glycosyltransferase family 2 protein n=1 Tax=Fusobacterium ulcerans TaxID=861 RepID=UPI001032F6DF|nr:glycosyltransferase family 2 protein [Fusobacterium ulcerans]
MLSVIVAAYNVEKYIEKCINSLVNQTYKNLEILVVNDGSTDNTKEIMEKYEKEYKNLKLLNKENGGLSSARNYGINHSKGEYITFVDGDDYVDEEMYEEMLDKMIRENSDMCICNFRKIYSNKIKIPKLNYTLFKGELVHNFLLRHDEIFAISCNKIYKKEIIINNNIFFINKAFFDDLGFNSKYILYTRKVSIVNKAFYNYIQREGSITKGKVYNPYIEKAILDLNNNLKLFYKNHNFYEKYKLSLEGIYIRMKIYKINYMLKFNYYSKEDINEIKFIFTLYLPLKHKIAVILMKLKLYKFIYIILKNKEHLN